LAIIVRTTLGTILRNKPFVASAGRLADLLLNTETTLGIWRTLIAISIAIATVWTGSTSVPIIARICGHTGLTEIVYTALSIGFAEVTIARITTVGTQCDISPMVVSAVVSADIRVIARTSLLTIGTEVAVTIRTAVITSKR
jgi:hypothetical protein